MMMTTTSRWLRFKAWLIFKLLKGGIAIECEVRHGAFRARIRQVWKGGLVRAEIPVQQKHGVTDTPFGRVSSQDAQALIDAFTGIEGEDHFQECRPGRDDLVRVQCGKTVCAACGQDLKRP